MFKFGKAVAGGALIVGGALLMFKGVKTLGDMYFDTTEDPIPKFIFTVVKPGETVIESSKSES